MDAYRTSGFVCPKCPSSPSLREYQNRLVCDECNGMLISDGDFVTSIQELDGSTEKLTFLDETPAKAACPRCRGEMTSCTVMLGALKLHSTFLRCASDGIWFPRAALAAVFARVSRRGGFRGLGASHSAPSSRSTGPSGSAATSWGNIGNMPSGHSGMSAVMAGIANAFGGGSPASSGLAISNWGSTRPMVHTLFVSAHKDRRLGCPSCGDKTALSYQGDRWACTGCAGSYVENAALEAMVVEMALKPWGLPAISGAVGERACPICSTKMAVELLEAVTIDRCAEHGVWFDDTELQAALHHASAEPSGVGGWIKHLFHRGAK